MKITYKLYRNPPNVHYGIFDDSDDVGEIIGIVDPDESAEVKVWYSVKLHTKAGSIYETFESIKAAEEWIEAKLTGTEDLYQAA